MKKHRFKQTTFISKKEQNNFWVDCKQTHLTTFQKTLVLMKQDYIF